MAVLANEVDPNIDTEYSLYHEKAEYRNEQYGMSYIFDFASFNPQEKSTVESELKSARDGYTSRLLKNTITTSYLGHAQDADESAILYKDANDEPTYDDWNEVSSIETVFDEYTLWHTEYLYVKGDVSEVTVFEWIQPRSLEFLGPWVSIEENHKYETSGVSVEVESSEPVEQEQNGAVAKWNIRTFNLQATVTLAGSKQYDKWRAKEGNNFSVTYRGKTLTIERKGYRVDNTTDLKDKGVVGDYREWGYSNVLEYEWGDNIKYSSATGTIKVLEPKNEDKFFPPAWGDLLEAKQTNTNSNGHNGSLPAWSLRFAKGVLPVIIDPGNDVPNWDFSLFEYTTVTDYNSATYVMANDTWVNTTAEDGPNYMVWERDHKEYATKNYSEAGKHNWDDGHTVNGHPSVYTSRYRLELVNNCLTATDTYTGRYMGSWK